MSAISSNSYFQIINDVILELHTNFPTSQIQEELLDLNNFSMPLNWIQTKIIKILAMQECGQLYGERTDFAEKMTSLLKRFGLIPSTENPQPFPTICQQVARDFDLLLQNAIEQGNLGLVKLLFNKRSAKIEQINKAIEHNQTEILKFLLTKFNSSNPLEFKAIWETAIICGGLATLKFIESFCAIRDHLANDKELAANYIGMSYGQNFETFSYFIEICKKSFKDKDFAEILNSYNAQGRTIFQHHLYYGKKENIELLIKLGADRTLQDKEENTSLHYAVQSGNYELVTLLYPSCQQFLNSKNIFGQAPIFFASNLDILKFLIEKEAIIDLVDSEGNTLLFKLCLATFSTSQEKINAIELILKKSPAKELLLMNQKNKRTLLLFIAIAGDLEVYQFLRKRFLELNPKATDEQGSTILHYIAQTDSAEFWKYAIYNENCDRDQRNLNEQTPLQSAFGSPAIIEYEISTLRTRIQNFAQRLNTNLSLQSEEEQRKFINDLFQLICEFEVLMRNLRDCDVKIENGVVTYKPHPRYHELLVFSDFLHKILSDQFLFKIINDLYLDLDLESSNLNAYQRNLFSLQFYQNSIEKLISLISIIFVQAKYLSERFVQLLNIFNLLLKKYNSLIFEYYKKEYIGHKVDMDLLHSLHIGLANNDFQLLENNGIKTGKDLKNLGIDPYFGLFFVTKFRLEPSSETVWLEFVNLVQAKIVFLKSKNLSSDFSLIIQKMEMISNNLLSGDKITLISSLFYLEKELNQLLLNELYQQFFCASLINE
ncbi:MAG: ankyrin repeat domain-containing protein [Chlamydiae bacterium]|nr:ankyrin repeat domain-containing protein [Chlamydiota bacterium]